MNFDFKEREKEGIVLIDLEGQLHLGEEDLQLKSLMSSLAERARAKVVLNLGRVEDIDMTCTGTLRPSLGEFRGRGGNLVLLNPPLSRLEPAVALQIGSEFDIFDDEQYAINSFFPDRIARALDLRTLMRRLQASSGNREP